MGYTGTIRIKNDNFNYSQVEYKCDGRSYLRYASAYTSRTTFKEVELENVRNLFSWMRSTTSEYKECVDLLKGQVELLGLLSSLIEYSKGNEIIVNEESGSGFSQVKYCFSTKKSRMVTVEQYKIISAFEMYLDGKKFLNSLLSVTCESDVLCLIKQCEERVKTYNERLQRKIEYVSETEDFLKDLYEMAASEKLYAKYDDEQLIIYNQDKEFVTKTPLETYLAKKFLGVSMECYVDINTVEELDNFVATFDFVKDKNYELENLIKSIEKEKPFQISIGGSY